MPQSRSAQSWACLLVFALIAFTAAMVRTTAQSPGDKWWTGYGNGPDNSRYFPSTQRKENDK